MATAHLDDDTKQSAHLRSLAEIGAFDNDPDEEYDEDGPGYGADPFDILAHKQETSQ